MAPSDIIYMIKSPPMYGFLEVDPPIVNDKEYQVTGGQDSGGITVFDQSVINEGRLHYIQSISNQSSDSFTFDVTNGISELKGLLFRFTILPKTLYIETRPMEVTEGSRTALTTRNLRVITEYYVDKIEDYLIVDPPTWGKLVAVSSSLMPSSEEEEQNNVLVFSVEDLMHGRIQVSSIHFFRCCFLLGLHQVSLAPLTAAFIGL